MTAPYSLDLRERALARQAAGETTRKIAAALQISPSCVSKWTKRQRETGSLAPAQIGGYKPRTLSGGRPRRRQRPGRAPHLPAAPQPRSQSDRTGLRQARASGPKGPTARGRSHLAKGRPTPRPLQPHRMLKLPRQLRICFRLNESRSGASGE